MYNNTILKYEIYTINVNYLAVYLQNPLIVKKYSYNFLISRNIIQLYITRNLYFCTIKFGNY